MKLSIKRLQSSDIGALRQMSLDFTEEMGLEYPHMDTNEVDTHMLQILATIDNADTIYLLAFDGKKPAGFFIGYIGDKPYSQPRRVGVAQELYVVPEKRAGVVGLKLMEEAAKIALTQGAEGFEAIGSYNGTDKRWEKFGFKPHTTYLHMNTDDFMSLVQRFTRRVA